MSIGLSMKPSPALIGLTVAGVWSCVFVFTLLWVMSVRGVAWSSVDSGDCDCWGVGGAMLTADAIEARGAVLFRF
jgi:hypothetical protein